MHLLLTKIIKLLIPLSFFIACNKSSINEDNPSLSEEKMIEVLADVHIAEAYISKFRDASKDSSGYKLYNQIYTLHDIDQNEFNTNLEYYLGQPEQCDRIYQKLIEHLSNEQAEAKGSEKNNKE